MPGASRADNLLDRLMKFSRMPWYWATAIAAAVLLIFLILVVYLDGFFVLGTAVSELNFWRHLLDSPVMAIYILMVYPLMRRLRNRAIQVFQPLLSREEGVSDQLTTEVFMLSRRREWGAVLIGIVFWIVVEQPWGWWWGPGTFWINMYGVATFPLLFGLMGWLIYDTLAGTLHIYRLGRHDLKLDIFDTGLLTPIASSSLGISVAFIGGISLNIVFQTGDTLRQLDDIIIYSILVCVAVLAFFLSMWGAHNAIARVKKRELALARNNQAAAYREIKEHTSQGVSERMESLSHTITVWVNYERRVKEIPTWPFNANIIRRLIASTAVPALVYLIKILSGLGFRL